MRNDHKIKQTLAVPYIFCYHDAYALNDQKSFITQFYKLHIPNGWILDRIEDILIEEDENKS
jgi:hypothetical protein